MSGSTNKDKTGSVQVPNLVAMNLAAAEGQLSQLGLSSSRQFTQADSDSGGPWDEVIDQEPGPGSWLAPGGQVVLKALSPVV